MIRPEAKSEVDDTITEMALQNLSKHSNIIQIYRTYMHDDTYYLVMEWMDGGDLSDLIREKSVTFNEPAISYIAQQILLYLVLRPHVAARCSSCTRTTECIVTLSRST